MADRRVFQEQQVLPSKFSPQNLKMEIKKRMNWYRSDWEREGEGESNMSGLITSLKFWKRKLGKVLKDTATVVTLFNESSFTKIDRLSIIKAIQDLKLDIYIEGFTDFRNPKYLAIHFRTEKMKKLVVKKLKCVGEDYVVFLDWVMEENSHNFRIHWLPMGHELTNLKVFLEKYIDILDIQRENFPPLAGEIYKSGLLTVRAMLKKGVTLKSLPHVAVIDELDCLITVNGREPLCLTCDKLGHISARCPTPFCRRCRKLHARGVACSVVIKEARSYSSVLGGGPREDDLQARVEGQQEGQAVDTFAVVQREEVKDVPIGPASVQSDSYTLVEKTLWVKQTRKRKSAGRGRKEKVFGPGQEYSSSEVESSPDDSSGDEGQAMEVGEGIRESFLFPADVSSSLVASGVALFEGKAEKPKFEHGVSELGMMTRSGGKDKKSKKPVEQASAALVDKLQNRNYGKANTSQKVKAANADSFFDILKARGE